MFVNKYVFFGLLFRRSLIANILSIIDSIPVYLASIWVFYVICALFGLAGVRRLNFNNFCGAEFTEPYQFSEKPRIGENFGFYTFLNIKLTLPAPFQRLQITLKGTFYGGPVCKK